MSEAKAILLIDSDKNYLSLLKMTLQERGYAVDIAYTGPDGLRKVVPGKYFSVIMGFILPFMKGDEVAEKIRRIDTKVRLILVTGYKQTIPQSILSSFNSVFEKPINTDQILNTLRRT